MTRRGSNRVSELRAARHLSQAALAAAAGVTRQSVNAIEAGRAIPAVDIALRMARALNCPVESLFGEADTEPRLTTEPVGDTEGGRVALSYMAGRWLSYPLDRHSVGRSADAIARPAELGRQEVDLLRTSSECRDNVVIMGCAPALGLLADRLNAHAGPGRFLWLTRSSTKALEALSRSQTHVAGVHLVDAKTGEANIPDVRRHIQERAVVVITLARWQAGLVVAAGNPKGISGVAELGRKGLRLVVREPGSGARRVLERELKRLDLPMEIARGAPIQTHGHLDVAHAIAVGAGDAGIATRDAALTYDLGFVPIVEERYDLVVPRDDLTDPRLARLFDVMAAAPFRRELSSLGYDVAQCGDRVAEILAA